jgi:hypothetical protein
VEDCELEEKECELEEEEEGVWRRNVNGERNVLQERIVK